MRMLLDECIDEGLRHYFIGHDCQTCRYANLRELDNGRLLTAAEGAGFQVLVTVDKNMAYQRNLQDRAIAVVTLDAGSTNLDDLVVLMPDVLVALESLAPGVIVRIAGK